MRKMQSEKFRKARNSFAAAVVVIMSAAIVGAPANAQTPLTMGPAEPTTAMKCHVVQSGNNFPWKAWQCNHCFSLSILGTYCTGAYYVIAQSNPAGD